jgi:serine phosphatase RsbU (regulator of sigma subunit)
MIRSSHNTPQGEGTLQVLLVEDNPGDALLLRTTLADLPAPAPALEWTHVALLEEGIGRLTERQFDVILLDLSLPDSYGLHTFDRVTNHAPETPVVMMTGLNDEEMALEAMQRGAQDYLVKGATDGRSIMRAIRYAIERTRRGRAERTLRAQQEEFEVAREIQQRLFPSAAPRFGGYDIGGRSHPAIAAGGDYYDFVPMPGGHLAVIVGDVCGHGIAAALVMAEARAYLRALMLTRTHVDEILGLANRALVEDVVNNRFITLMLARLSTGGPLVYSSAGHGMSYVLDASGKVKHSLTSTGIPLGIDASQAFPAAEPIALAPGDLALLCTDGVMEARSADGDDFGVERALELVRRYRMHPAQEIVDRLCGAALDHCGHNQADDITAVVIRVEGGDRP